MIPDPDQPASQAEVRIDIPEEQLAPTDLPTEIEITENALRRARVKEKAYFKKNATWEASSSFWKGEDWTAEEKQELYNIQTKIGTGAVAAAAAVTVATLRFLSLKWAAEAASARSDADQQATGDVTPTNQGLENSAWAAVPPGAFEIIALTALNPVINGIREWWGLCAKHQEKVKNHNMPEIAKKRAGLEEVLRELKAEETRINQHVGQ